MSLTSSHPGLHVHLGFGRNSSEKTPWDDSEYHGYLTAEPRETQGRETLESRGYSERTTITPIVTREMATFSPVSPDGDMPLCDLSGLQALAERGKF